LISGLDYYIKCERSRWKTFCKKSLKIPKG